MPMSSNKAQRGGRNRAAVLGSSMLLVLTKGTIIDNETRNPINEKATTDTLFLTKRLTASLKKVVGLVCNFTS